MGAEALPQEYRRIFEKVFSDEIIFFCEADISENHFCDGYFAMSKTRMATAQDGALRYVKNMSDINRVCCAQYAQSGALEIFADGGNEIAARFSMKNTEGFMLATVLAEDIIRGEPVSEYGTEKKEVLCPKCGRPFIRDTKICRRCTDKKGAVEKLWKLSKPCRPIYALLLLLFWLSSMFTIINPIISKHLTDDVLNKKGASPKTLVVLISIMLVCTVGTSLISALRTAAASKASNLLVRDLRTAIYEKLAAMPLGEVEKRKTGDLMQRINNDTARIQTFIQDIAIMAVNEAVMFAAIAVITFSMNIKMSLLIFAPMPIALFLINRIRTVIQRRYRKQWRVMDKLTSRLTDVLNGIKTVKVFGREKDETRRFENTAAAVRDITMRNEKYVYTFFPLIQFIMGFGSYFVLLYGGASILRGEMTVGELVQFGTYGGYLYSKLEWFSMLPRHFTMAVASSQRVFEILDENETEENDEADVNKRICGDFVFDDVSFGYKSYKRVLKNINEHIRPGEMIGLVGRSGVGKSTLINLVMKLYRPNRGKIILDGENLDKYKSSYRKALGIVLQENYLFSGSILDNIRYAAPSASLEKCVAAAKKANAHDFIMQLPDAYNTDVGEKGYRLSGGERQRIAIARAICADPDIIILDEATASVDTQTEQNIQSALKNVTNGKTVFAIAHRLSTLKNADRLLVLEQGRVAESGTHEELLNKNGIYAGLLRAQQEMTRARATIDDSTQSEKKKGS